MPCVHFPHTNPMITSYTDTQTFKNMVPQRCLENQMHNAVLKHAEHAPKTSLKGDPGILKRAAQLRSGSEIGN